MATATKEGAVYERWFVDSLRFDGIGSSGEEKRGLADLVGNYAADFETRASQDNTALSVTWDLFGDESFDNAEAEMSLLPGEVGGPRIKEEPKDYLPSIGERVAYREAWRKLSSDAARSVEVLEQIGVSLPNGRNSTDEARLLLWAYLVQRQRSDPIWFGTNQIPSPFEVKSGDFGAFSLIARALRHLERRLIAGALTGPATALSATAARVAANLDAGKPIKKSNSEAGAKPDSANKSECPRGQSDHPDPTTRALIAAQIEGANSGRTVEEVNRDFFAKRRISPKKVATMKRAERRFRAKQDSGADK